MTPDRVTLDHNPTTGITAVLVDGEWVAGFSDQTAAEMFAKYHRERLEPWRLESDLLCRRTVGNVSLALLTPAQRQTVVDALNRELAPKVQVTEDIADLPYLQRRMCEQADEILSLRTKQEQTTIMLAHRINECAELRQQLAAETRRADDAEQTGLDLLGQLRAVHDWVQSGGPVINTAAGYLL